MKVTCHPAPSENRALGFAAFPSRFGGADCDVYTQSTLALREESKWHGCWEFPWWRLGLRTWRCCHRCGAGRCRGVGSIPGPSISTCCGGSQKGKTHTHTRTDKDSTVVECRNSCYKPVPSAEDSLRSAMDYANFLSFFLAF